MFRAAIPASSLESAFWCCFYGAGIIGMLVIYGLFQERIMSLEYGGELFKVSVFLVLCNRLVAVVFSACMLKANGEGLANMAPLWKYLAVSMSNVGASTCQYEALKYVAFPVQMLGKSFKMMPVMVWGMAISGKSYSFRDWAIALFVTGGVTQFLMTGEISSAHSGGNSSYGLALLATFLVLDGFTSTFQEKLFKEHKTSKYNQMFYVNLASVTVSATTLLMSGAWREALSFCVAHPLFVRDAAALSAAAVSGQWFIISQIKEFGALVFAATMNVRQVVSILLSYATYGHSITLLQILGLAMVFGALFYKSYLGFVATCKKEKDTDASGEKMPLKPSENATKAEP